MTSILRVCSIVLPLLVVACGTTSTSTPRIRVARDLGCTAEHTTVARIGEYRWEVSGCGRTATYVCTYPVRDCWREGEIRTLGSAMPARVSTD
jgi:hypothetical protein